MPASAPVTDHARLNVLRLGQASRPWDFLNAAIAWLSNHTDDHGVRYLAASNAADLGLRTLANEFLRPLPPEAAADERVQQLQSRIDGLPNDEISFESRCELAERGLGALTARGHDLSDTFEQWKRTTIADRWFRSIDDNTVRWTAHSTPHSGWDWLGDHRAAARAFCQSTIECDEYNAPPPIVIDGVAPPWILLSLRESLKPTRTGYTTAIHLLQSDLHELFDGMACADLQEHLASPHTHLHLGPKAGELLKASLEARIEFELPGRVVLNPSTKSPASPSPKDALKELVTSQATELRRLIQQANEIYEPRDTRWWADRFEAIQNDNGEPLRVLIITSRYTTFVQESAGDLARAVRAAGGHAEVLIEPDDSTRLSKLAHLEAVARFKPDLFVLMNYTRTILQHELPRNLPVVCWIQDAMEHLFHPSAGAQQGPFDVLIGNYYADLFSAHGYDKARFLSTPVTACENKFHPESCANQSDRFECELAYVSHQSETPERMLERLKGEAEQPEIKDLLESLAPLVLEQTQHLATKPLRTALRERIEQTARRQLPELPNPRFISEALDQFAVPLAERIVRHEMLGWAAALAEKRGWRFNLYGNGWEEHPSLSKYAAGPIDHNDDLRACYQLAKVHLHASVSPLVHQRLMECALSGGFPFARLNYDALNTPERVIASVGFRPAVQDPTVPIDPDPSTHVGLGDRCRLSDHAVGYRLTDSPALLARASQLQRLSVRTPGDQGDVVWCDPKRARTDLNLKDCGLLEWNAARLFGNLECHTYNSQEQFEELTTKAVEDSEWRQARSNAISSSIRSHATYSALVARLTNWFSTTL